MEEMFTSLPEKKREILNGMIESPRQMNESTGSEDHKIIEPKEWNGYRFIPGFNPETAKCYFEEAKMEENGVFIFTYPKTGTNWTYEIASQIIYGDQEKLLALFKDLPTALTMIESGKPSKFDLLEHLVFPRKIFMSHLPAGLVDFEKMKNAGAKIIIPIRNPKDQAVSWFHFTQQRYFDCIRDQMSREWSQFLQDYIEGKHWTTSKPGEWYPEFLLSWYKFKDEDNVMFVHFEDMKKDPEDSIRKIASFLDVKLSNQRVSAIARDTSFDAMKAMQQKGENEVAKVQARMKMMRKGQAGAWKNTFTVAQSELMDKIIQEKLGRTDIKFRYG